MRVARALISVPDGNSRAGATQSRDRKQWRAAGAWRWRLEMSRQYTGRPSAAGDNFVAFMRENYTTDIALDLSAPGR